MGVEAKKWKGVKALMIMATSCSLSLHLGKGEQWIARKMDERPHNATFSVEVTPELVEAMTVQDSMEAYYEEMTKGEEVHCIGTRTRKRIRCVICMNSKFTKIKLPCGHIFHRKCIDEWARWKPKCPVCDATLQLVPDKEGTSSSSTV